MAVNMGGTILVEPLLDPLLLYPPLVVDAIQEFAMQDDHLAVVEEEEVFSLSVILE